MLELMTASDVQPNVISYNAAISACTQGSQWERALNLFEPMSLNRVWPNNVSYNAAMSACEKGGQWQHALALIADMTNVKLSPEVYGFSTAISACEKMCQWQQALKLMEAAYSARECNVVTYSAAGWQLVNASRANPNKSKITVWLFSYRNQHILINKLLNPKDKHRQETLQ